MGTAEETNVSNQQQQAGANGVQDAQAGGRSAHGDIAAPENAVVLDQNRKLGRGVILSVALLGMALGLFIFMGILSRVHAEESLSRETKQSSILSVAVTTPNHGANALEVTLPANTQAFIDTPIYARTNGYLRKWYADIGAHVRQGQVLAEIETPELDQQVQQAQSDLKTAEANEQIAQITSDRWKKLLAKNAVSKQEADQASSDFNAKESALSSAQANVRRLQQLQGFEKIFAPFDGIITARNVDIGSLIEAGDSNTPKAELFHISASEKLRLFVPVPEVYANTVHNGDHVTITTDASPDAKYTGTIVRNSDAIDMTSRTLNVEVDVQNSAHALRPGQYAFIHLPIPPSNSSMTLPSNALLFRAEGLRVGVVRNNQVALVPVKVGHDYGATVEIIAGLHPEDRVILNPSDSLAEGEQVQVEKDDVQ